MSDELVLVTGGSGYIGVECIRQLLNGGYRVRTTVRSLKRSDDVKGMLNAGEIKNLEKLDFAAADLTKDEGWTDAVKDCIYVLHVASPFPASAPKDENELIVPAREGTLRVLRAARDAGAKRVVLTSSFAAIGYSSNSGDGRILTEKDWTDDKDPKIAAYQKSKTLAERAAWDFIGKEGGSMELSVINPVGVFGPVYSKDYSTSIQIVERLMNGSMPGVPRIQFGIVDVRDVAELHIRAMTIPEAKGQRFLAVSGSFMTIQEIALMLKERLPGKKSKKVPTRILPDFLLRFIGLFDTGVSLVVPELGKDKKVSNERARTVLKWEPISREDSLVASAESLFKLGVLKE